MIIQRLMTERGYAVKAALVVAHPDDEALWFGGLLATVPFEWTVICCSIPERDPIRAWKFYRSCEILGATGMVMPLQETGPNQIVRAPVFDLLGKVLDDFDLIVTHSSAGEYGHLHHRDIARWISANYQEVAVRGLYGVEAAEDPDALFRVELSEDDWTRKCKAIQAYDHMAESDNGHFKWEALLKRYHAEWGGKFDLRKEGYVGPT